MEQFIHEISLYAQRTGRTPSTVIQKAGVSGGKWRKWESGESSPTLNTVDRLRKYMAENPPPDDVPEGAAA
ncbi:helix-turn-helix transcriptional regulator [Rhodobacteraceae bacterium G21628-S1]|nr:helix-turn-helix transcriptional regulator [Rhodobacteraceae bacterium G21628-S1]